MVTANVYRDFGDVQDTFEDMEVSVLAPVAAIMAGGVFLAQAAQDQALPQLGMSQDPETVKGLAVSTLLKMAASVGLVMTGGTFSSKAAGLGTVLGLGILASSGADMWQLASNIMGTATSQTSVQKRLSRAAGSSGGSSRSRSRARRSRSATRRSSGGASSSASASKKTTRANTPRSRKKELNNWG